MTNRPPTPDDVPLPQLGDDAERDASLHRLVPGGGMETVSYAELKSIAPPPAPTRSRRRVVDVLLALAAAASVFGAIAYVRGSAHQAAATKEKSSPAASVVPSATITAAASAPLVPSSVTTSEPSASPPPTRAVRRSPRPSGPPPAFAPARTAETDPWGWKR